MRKAIETPKRTKSITLPPVHVELSLAERLRAIANKEDRTISDVMRCAMREGLDYRAENVSKKKL